METRLGVDLRRALFDPLLPALGGRTRLVVALDGELARLPFEVLPTDDGRRLIDEYAITYVTVARDTVRLGPAARAMSEPLIVADPAFDLEEDDGRAEREPPRPRQARWEELSGLTFDWARRHSGGGRACRCDARVEPLLGSTAHEAWIKSCRSPQVLHLATHGFFLADREWPRRQTLEARALATTVPSGPQADNPMLRSGLALDGMGWRPADL